MAKADGDDDLMEITIKDKRSGDVFHMAANPKTFKTKSTGYWVRGTGSLGGKAYAMQFQAVLAGSKPKVDGGDNSERQGR